MVNYNIKYDQRQLTIEEKEALNELLQKNKNNLFYNDIFSSLQILMNEILKDNYDQNDFIYKIIESLPNNIILNNELIKLFRSKYEYNPEDKIFTVNTLLSMFEYLESVCWKEIQKYIPIDYKNNISEEIKQYIIDFFSNNNEEKLINKNNLSTALRRLISRYITGKRLSIDIKSESALKLYIMREDLWNKNILNSPLFEEEIERICKNDILVCHCYSLFNILDGGNFMDIEINKEINKKQEKDIIKSYDKKNEE